MTFDMSTLAKSLAAHLAPFFPGVTFLEDPAQQAGNTPNLFLQIRDAEVEQITAIGSNGRYKQTMRFDLVYLEDYNLPDLQQRYLSAAGRLDVIMANFEYTSPDGETATLNTYERDWRVDLDALHYRFAVKVILAIPTPVIPMGEIQGYDDRILP